MLSPSLRQKKMYERTFFQLSQKRDCIEDYSMTLVRDLFWSHFFNLAAHQSARLLGFASWP